MNSFISNAACRGRRPRQLVKVQLKPRPILTAQLMAERQVARFLTAPPGYGKSCLALEYAQTVFDLCHVFWLDCQSPCFLRDLDKGDLAESVFQLDDSAALVVLSNLPRLGSQRVEELSRCMDFWMENGCEVLATTTPSCDAFSRHQPDRICLGGAHLLLTEDELPGSPSEAGESKAFDGQRIPLIGWGDGSAWSTFVTKTSKEPLPRDLRFLFFLIMLFGRATGSSLQSLMRYQSLSGLEPLLAAYPHLGFNSQQDSFWGLTAPVDVLCATYRSSMGSFAEAGYAQDASSLIVDLAQNLLEQGMPQRACDLVRHLGVKDVKRQWSIEQGPGLLARLQVHPLCCLLSGLRLPADEDSCRVRVLEACCLELLGKTGESTKLAKRVVSSSRALPEDAALAAFLLLRKGEASQRRLAMAYLKEHGDDLNAFERVAYQLEKNPSLFPLQWAEMQQQSLDKIELLLAACVAFPMFPDDVMPVVLDYLEGSDPSAEVGLATFIALRTCREREDQTGAVGLVSPEWMMAFYRRRTDLAQQVVDYRAFEQERKAAAASPNFNRAYGDWGLTIAPPERTVTAEILDVRMFGGLEVYLGGRMLDPLQFRRQKVRALLSILVLRAGKELSRDKLVASLWPDSPLPCARKNFYTIWSILRRVLTPTGSESECPYLFHIRGGYKLDDRYLSSDVKRIDEICAHFKFEPVESTQWVNLLQELVRISDGEILPGENENQIVLSAREEYRVKVVNALVTGAGRLRKAELPEHSLWFAQEAFDRETQREDVYYALMAAQLACGQREAALETFYKDKRFLADTLGIDPSTRMVELYRRILEEEEVF